MRCIFLLVPLMNEGILLVFWRRYAIKGGNDWVLNFCSKCNRNQEVMFDIVILVGKKNQCEKNNLKTKY